MSMAHFTQADYDEIDHAEAYADSIWVDDENCVRWKATNNLVDTYCLKLMARYGPVSQNEMMTTSDRRGERLKYF